MICIPNEKIFRHYAPTRKIPYPLCIKLDSVGWKHCVQCGQLPNIEVLVGSLFVTCGCLMNMSTQQDSLEVREEHRLTWNRKQTQMISEKFGF